MKTFRSASFSVALVPLALAALAISAPLLANSALLSFSIRRFFSIVCHEDPARSFWLAGAPVAVCVRCLGIYLGAALGAGLNSARASRPRLLRIVMTVAALNALDVAAESLSLHGNLPTLRFALGLAMGAALGALVAASVVRSAAESAALNLHRSPSHPL